MNIPEKYKDDDIEKIDQVFRVAMRALLKGEKGLYVYGGVGTGKTYAVWALINRFKEMFPMDILSNHFRVYNITDLLERIKDTYSNDLDEFLSELFRYDGILVIDDIGVERCNEWAQEQLYRIINNRYERNKKMFFTSNLSLDELESHSGPRIVSRIVETCNIIKLNGEDKRLKI